MSLNGQNTKSFLSDIKLNTSLSTRNIGTRTSDITKSTNKNIIPAPRANGFNENIDNTLNKLDSIISPDMPINSIEITFPSSAGTIQLSSTSANDTSAGTGARLVQINGLDSNFNMISEIMTMNGTSASTASTNLFLRINDMLVISSGSNDINVGSIYVSPSTDTIGGTTTGVPDTFILNLIKPETNLSTTAIFTVPNNHDFLPLEIQFSSDSSENKPVDIRFWFRFNNLSLPKFEASEVQLTSGFAVFNVDTFLFPTKMDYFVTAVGSSATSVKVKHNLTGVLRKIN